MIKQTRLVASTVLLTGFAMAPLAQATDLRFASGYPTNSIASDALKIFENKLQEYSDDSLDVDVYELSLLNLAEASAGVRDGMADMAVVLTPYFPAEYPHTNMVAEISMSIELSDEPLSQSGLIYTGAMSEYILFHCSECQDEFSSQNQLFLGSASTPAYSLLCNTPVNSLETLENKQLRTSGAMWARWAEEMGANPITMSVNEIYEGLSQGVVDCSVQSTAELSVFNLFEVVNAITLNYPGGVFSGVGVGNINKDSWQSLSKDQRQALLRAAATLSAEFSWGYDAGALENEITAREQGIDIIEPTAAMREANQAFIRDDLQTIADNYAERYEIQDPEAKIAKFQELLSKWEGLIDNIESGEELADLYWEEVFSRVDVASYGQ